MGYNKIDDIFQELNLELTRDQVYENYTLTSEYIRMRDGVKIAADIYLPENFPSGTKIPTILVQTCYWRVKVLRGIFKWMEKMLIVFNFQKEFIKYGYAIVYTDVRGTGASFGTRPYPWSGEEIRDNKDIIDWIITQPWSDGNVVTWGHSYLGTTAELAGVVNHPALKGLAPMHNEFDPYLDIAFPGGVYDEYFVDNWALYTLCLDHNSTKGMGLLPRLLIKGAKPVDSDIDKSLLKQASKEHLANVNVAELAKQIRFRDESWNESGATIKNFSVYRFKEELEKSNVLMFSWASWRDAATANAVIERFLTFKNPQLCLIGAWTHAAYYDANPYLPLKKREPNPTYTKQVQLWMRFFETCLKGKKIPGKTIIYYTMAEDKWKITSTWPPVGQIREKWYFNENNRLTQSKPIDDTGVDNYRINYKATTGKKNRWYTQMGGGPVIYKNRAKEDKKLLIYDSLPIEKDIEITGYPIVTLYLASTLEDGAIFVYLEDVDEMGNVIYIIEGQLRLIHRKVLDETPIYNILFPYHSFKKKDASLLVPGEITEINFGLLPTSVLIRKGHKIRIAIAGADKDTFARHPKEGTPIINISRNKAHSSFIDLPIIQKK